MILTLTTLYFSLITGKLHKIEKRNETQTDKNLKCLIFLLLLKCYNKKLLGTVSIDFILLIVS